jgi:hypothetical protein
MPRAPHLPELHSSRCTLGIVGTPQPLPPDCEQRRHNDGTNEEADQSEHLQAAENSNQCHQERQPSSVADQPRPYEVITREHDGRAPSKFAW